MRRAMTLIEMLLSLALLTSMVVAATAWVQLASRSGTVAVGPIRWRMAADAFYQFLVDDLRTGDFMTRSGEKRRAPRELPQVRLENGELTVTTRFSGIGALAHRYRFNDLDHVLIVEQRLASGEVRQRPLLFEVDEFTCILDEERGFLDVLVVSSDGQELSRKFLLR